MPTRVDRQRLVPLLRREFEAIATLCDAFDDGAWETPTCLPGWTVKDQLSHLVGTERMLEGEQPPDVDVSHLDHVGNEIGAFNERWVESLRPLPGPVVLDGFREVTARRLAHLESMTQEDFDAPSLTPVGDESYGRFMRIRLFDCFLHEHDMREALGAPDRPDPQQLEVVLDEVAAAMGYVVGRRASMPAGQRVRVEITGEAGRVLDLEVGERAELVDHLQQEPTVGVRLPAMLFLRLVGGRRDPAPHLDRDVTLTGDGELARRLATSLAYTI